MRVERGGIDPGVPGQFFMLEAPGRVLPRPMSLCLAPRGELAFLLDPIGPGHARARRARARATRSTCSARSATAFGSTSQRPLLVAGGIGIAPMPYLSEALEHPPAVLGFRSEQHAEAAALVPNAEVVIDPVLVTDVLPPDRDVLACGPEPMLEARPRARPGAQLAWEAPMACGYGACYGCVVEIDGELKRLCVEGRCCASPERERLPRRADGARRRARHSTRS